MAVFPARPTNLTKQRNSGNAYHNYVTVVDTLRYKNIADHRALGHTSRPADQIISTFSQHLREEGL